MTEYGRGSGSQPWHPEDPLYGDQGYNGQQYPQQQQPQQQSQPPYGQQYPEQQQYAEQQYGWDPSQSAGGQYGANPAEQYGRQDYYGPDGYPQQQEHHTGQHQQPHQTGQHQQPHQTGQHQQPEQHTGQHQQPHQTGQHQQPHQTGQHEQPHHTGQHQQPRPGVPQQAHDTGQHEQWHPEPEPEPEEEKHPFFTGADDPDDPDGTDDSREESRRDRRGKGKSKGNAKGKNKRRSGTACLLVAVVLVGVVGGGGYLAYDYWQTHFGAAPDYSGEGSGEVQVEIPKGSTLTGMGQVLEKAGVVKSVGAFTAAAGKGVAIQPGTYTLRKEMSGSAAVAMMTHTGNFLTIGEGRRAVQIYAAIDQKLGLKQGTTKDVATSQVKNLGLPEWANSDPKIKDPLEGFLYPSQYSAAKGTKPEAILKQMVARAKENYAKEDLEGKAKELGLKSPLQLITVASMVNAEGMTHDDFRKMARVIYNRLKPTNIETNGKLEFDSTYNYLKNQSKLDLSPKQLRSFDDPYNTYFYRGLTPGPIGNPGAEALKAAMDPEAGDWYYFVSIDGKTRFTKNLKEHQKLVDEFNESQKAKKQG
ncbi:putative aminodeoxychorismate lyase [Streptomyces netropsis]|nr:putative aminodeoxychorismate lyase [Streptomyces netropsis]